MGRIEPWGDRPPNACRTLGLTKADAWGSGDLGSLGPGATAGASFVRCGANQDPLAILLTTDSVKND